MRDRMERFVILPFSVGCVSESSVAVAVRHPRRSKTDTITSSSSATRTREEDEESLSSESMKYSLKFLALPKPDISTGLHRLFKSLKTFSQLFAYNKEEMEKLEKEMEIGFPTDVKHVTHIGWDGSSTSSTVSAGCGGGGPNTNMGWENLLPHELLNLPSLHHYELSVDTQPAKSPLLKGSA